MDFWLIGLIAAGAVVLYLVVLAVGVLLGIGGMLVQFHQGDTGTREADLEHRAKLRAARQRIEAKTGGRTVLPYPINRAERRKQRRRA